MKDEDFREVDDLARHRLRCACQRFAAALRNLVLKIDDCGLYSCSTLAALAKDQGLVSPEQSASLMVLLDDIAGHETFFKEPDGLIYLTGLVPFPGWFGMRWRSAIWKAVMAGDGAAPVGRLIMFFSWNEEA